MDFKAEDFPPYQLLLVLNQPGMDNAKQEFADAQTGSDHSLYRFALGIQGLALTPGIENLMPGLTEDDKLKTLESCLAVFQDVAGRGHKNADLLATYLLSRGLSFTKKFPGNTPAP